MAIPFLNHLDLRSISELQNALLHLTTEASASNVEGKIIYDTGSNTVKYYDGSSWISLTGAAGTVTSVTSGNTDTITIGGTAAAPTVAANTAAVTNGSANLATGDQIFDFVDGSYLALADTLTFSGGDVTGTGSPNGNIGLNIGSNTVEAGMLNDNVISGQTELASGLVSTDELLVSDAGTIKRMDISVLEAYMQSNLTFTDDTDTTYDLAVPASTTKIRLTGSDSTTDDVEIAGGTNVTVTRTNANTLTISSTDTNTQLSQEQVEDIVGGMLDGTETGITVSYDDTDGNIDFVVADTTVAGDTGSTGITPGDTLTIAGGTNVTTAMSGDTLTISSTNTQLSTEQVQDIVGAMFVGNTETRISATYQDGDGTIDLVVDDMTANDDVSKANLLTALASFNSTDTVNIGDSDDDTTVVIRGNLQVDGTTTTVNSTTVDLNDHNITLDSGNTTSAVINGAGITLDGGSGDDATFTYSTTGPKFELKLGSSYEDLQVDKLIAASLDISGNVDVDGTLEADAITVNGSTLNSVIDGRITAREYKANFPSSATAAGATTTITHNLGTRDVIVQFYALVADIDGDANTPNVDQYEEVKLENTRATTNTITVTPNTALVANALRVLIKEL